MKVAITLILVRHGETEGQSSIRYYGRTDLALSDLGREQMRAAARALSTRKFDQVFASPMRRAIEGAALIAGRDRAMITIPDFVEIDFGLFEGLTADEIRDRHPEEFARWQAQRTAADYAFPGGESRAEFTARVARGAERMFERWRAQARMSGTALLVAHRGVIRALIRSLTGQETVSELGSIQILEHDGGWRATMLDSVEHLRD